MANRYFIPIDKYGVPKQIDSAHDKIHTGNHFTASHQETIGAASTCDIMLTVDASDTWDYHIEIDVQSSLSGIWYLYETPDATGGTAITSMNNNRKSSTTSDLTIAHTPTVATVGTTILEQHTIGGTFPGSKTGGATTGRKEWDLNTDTKYLIRFTADSASTRTTINVYYYKDLV